LPFVPSSHPHRHHLHWPNLDVDLDLHSLTNLAEYPLVYR
jgi:hypothetical protein